MRVLSALLSLALTLAFEPQTAAQTITLSGIVTIAEKGTYTGTPVRGARRRHASRRGVHLRQRPGHGTRGDRFHLTEFEATPSYFAGPLPATVIYARELSEAALLDGIRSGRVYIRTQGPDGPVLELSGSFGVTSAQMGGILKVNAAGATVRVSVHVAGAVGHRRSRAQ